MTRVIGPCFSLDARGQLGKSVVYSIRRGVNYVRNFATAKNPKTEAQLEHRSAFQDGASKWRWGVIGTYAKSRWNTYAEGTSESGWNRFMRYYLKANYDSATKKKVAVQVIPDPQ